MVCHTFCSGVSVLILSFLCNRNELPSTVFCWFRYTINLSKFSQLAIVDTVCHIDELLSNAFHPIAHAVPHATAHHTAHGTPPQYAHKNHQTAVHHTHPIQARALVSLALITSG
jgi:hypothetical protein